MNDPTRKKKPSKSYHLRWCWLGCGLAFVLWFGSDVYYQRVAQIDQIENFNSSLSQDESLSQTTQKHHQWYHYAAIAIALGSITYGGKIALRAFKCK